MASDKFRRHIAFEAARLMYERQESEYYRAKLRAAKKIYRGWVKPKDLPSNTEIREQIQHFARLNEGERRTENKVDRFQVYRALLLPLETVRQSPHWHPEGDALYHSLQVFELARDELPYDEEFLLAALLHDVGKGIDPDDHIAAALEALDGFITPRTIWLIEHHMEAHALRDGTLGQRARRRLEEAEDFEELVLLSECDRRGRVCGAQVSEVDEAIDHCRDLARMYG
jgi:hypothetical protein